MKKIIALMITGIMIFALAACSSQKETEVVITEKDEEEETQLDGGWSRAESPEITDEVRELLNKATEGYDGPAYTPIAYIGSQVVAGTNHKILCGVTPVVPDAVTTYAIVVLYEDLNGNVEMIDYMDSEAEVEELPDSEGMTGGWSAVEPPVMTDEAKAALKKAVENLVGAEYEPVALLATQIVAGTNYSILCEVTPVTPDAETGYVIVHVYEDLDGNAEITDTFDFYSFEE